MSKVIIADRFLDELNVLDAQIRALNDQKIRLLLRALGIKLSSKEMGHMLTWELICVAVPDRQMAVQLNKLSAYVPHLLFVVDPDKELFEFWRGYKGRRVWKER